MTKEMDSVDVIFNAYDKDKKLTKGKAFPFMCHCVVSFISAKDAYEYLVENQFKVTHRTVVSWRRDASVWLGLAQTGKGRMSESDSQKMRDDWHARYGYPTYQDFFQGWKPGTSTPQLADELGGESMHQTAANSPVNPTQVGTQQAAHPTPITPAKRGGEVDDKSTLSEVGKSEPISVGSQNPTKSETLSKLSKFKRKTNK